MEKSLDKNIQKNIDNYSKKIITMKDFVSSVRQATGMYIGYVDSRAILNMFREIFQNSVDQLIDTNTPCNHIYVYYNEITRTFIVEDDGLGLPFDDMIRILTSQHTSKNYVKERYAFQIGLNGVGLKVVNALSSHLIAESYNYKGEARRLETVEGYITTKEPIEIPNKTKRQGTRIEFVPSSEIFGDDIKLDYTKVYKLVKRISSLTQIGSVFDVECVDHRGETHKEHIVNKDGIMTEIISRVKNPIIKPIIVSANDGYNKVDASICYDMGISGVPDQNEYVTSFSNFCPTTGGTHIDGTIIGIAQWFTNYMNKIYLVNQKAKIKLKVTANDVKSGLNVFISAAALDPVFTGQAKEYLSNSDMELFAKTTAMQGLDEWSKTNPQDLAKLAKWFKELAEIRQKTENAKVKIATKFQASALTGLPSKFKKPTGKDNLELIIVEGDSAGGSAKDARDVVHQGIFPIRGKIKNAFSAPMQVVFANEEVQGILKILFGLDHYKRGLTAADCKYIKIIFATDADIDGKHINALLLRLFLLYFPFLIEAGMVYEAVPPLFGVKNGKKTTYFTDRLDMIKCYQKEFTQRYVIKDSKKTLDNKEIMKLFQVNVDYIYEMDVIANRYSVDVNLLEYVLTKYLNGHTKIDALKKDITSKYRFMDIKEKKGTLCIEGVVNSKYQTLYFNEKFLNDCKNAIDIIKKNDQVYYKMNDEDASIYDIMNAFSKITPKNIERYKGLGEMQAEQLAESTLLPDGRTLIRYTIDDVKETIDTVRTLESNKRQILEMIDHVSRAELQGI